MNSPRTRPSLGRRVLGMFFTWLFLGALIGVIGGLGMGGGIQIVCMMIAGMVVLPIVGVVVGLIGGDSKGSVAGAACGLLGCSLVGCFGAVPIQPEATNVILVFGALVGATGFQFARFLLWKYVMMFRAICWVVSVTPSSAKAGTQMNSLITGTLAWTGRSGRAGSIGSPHYGLRHKRKSMAMARD